MSYLSLYRRWRSSNFEEVLGQPHVTETLIGAIKEDRLAHAYLFPGPRGTGKTPTARILAQALNCEQGITASPCCDRTPCKEIGRGSSLGILGLHAASPTSVHDVRQNRQ